MADSDDGQSSDVAASEGWTNAHVRDGFDVDGSTYRVNNLSRDWALHLHKMFYELFGAFIYRHVICNLDRWIEYPPRRLFWRVFGDERTAEQAIAESEFIKANVLETDRDGIGSTYWLLGVGVTVSLLLVGAGIGWAGFLLGDQGLEGLIPASIGLLTALGGVTTAGMAYLAFNHLPSLE